MSRQAKQQYQMTLAELERVALSGTNGEIQHALQRYRTVRDAGGSPLIYYSTHYGFLVLDVNDHDDREINYLIEPHALPYGNRISNAMF